MSIVNISSENATIGLDNNFEVKLKKPIQKVIGMQLLNATIPLTYNIINSSNDQLSFSYLPQTDIGDAFSSQHTTYVHMVATLDHGSYTADELAVEIDHSINQAISSDALNASIPLLPHELRTTSQRDLHIENEDLIIRIEDEDSVSFSSRNFSSPQLDSNAEYTAASITQTQVTGHNEGNLRENLPGGTLNNNTFRPDKLSSVSVNRIDPGMIVLFPVNMNSEWVSSTQVQNADINPLYPTSALSTVWWESAQTYSGSSPKVNIVYAMGIVLKSETDTDVKGTTLTIAVYDRDTPTIYTWHSVTEVTACLDHPQSAITPVSTAASGYTDVVGGKYPRLWLFWPGVLCHFDPTVQNFNIITAGWRRITDAIGRSHGLNFGAWAAGTRSGYEDAHEYLLDAKWATRMITWNNKHIDATTQRGVGTHSPNRSTRMRFSAAQFELINHITDFKFAPSSQSYTRQVTFTPTTDISAPIPAGSTPHTTADQVPNTMRMTRTVGFKGDEEAGRYAHTNRKPGHFENNMTYRGTLLPEVHGPSLFFVRIGGDLLLDQQNTETDMNDRLAIPISAEHGEVQHFESTAQADVIPAAVPCDIHRLKFTIEYGDDNQPVGGEDDAFLGHHTYFRLKFYKQHQQGKV